jgi:Spy/CpxP family protein refolding chaperone
VLVRSIAIALLAVCVSLPASSQKPPSSSTTPMPRHGSGMGYGMGMGHMFGMTSEEKIDRSLNVLQSSLSLSPTQVTKIRELARTRRENLQAIRDESRPKFQQLMSMLKQPNPDPAAVGRAVIELKTIHEQARMKQSDFENQVSSLLNPTQRQTVDNLRSQAPTFMALRGIGLIGREDFKQGMFTRESE